MRLVIFDFDGTIHLEETPRIFLRVLSQDKRCVKRSVTSTFRCPGSTYCIVLDYVVN